MIEGDCVPGNPICTAASSIRRGIEGVLTSQGNVPHFDGQLLGGHTVIETELIALILSFPEAEQSSHFGTTDFRIRGKIFASRPEPDRLVLKLSAEQQQVLTESEGGVFAKLPNKWGDKGWTSARIAALDSPTARSALQMAWTNVAPKRLATGR